MAIKRIISAAAKAAVKKARGKAGKKVISSKNMQKRLADKVEAKRFGESLTEYRRVNRLTTKMANLSPSSAAYKKLQNKLMDFPIPKRDPFPHLGPPKGPRKLKPIPGTKRIIRKEMGGAVINRGRKIPGMRYGN